MALTTVNSGGIKDDSIVNADIKSDAAIAGTKISSDFGSQNVVTTGEFRLASNAFIKTKSGATSHIMQNSLILDSNVKDIFFTGGSQGSKYTFGSSDAATHEVLRITPSVLGASQHGKVTLNYVTANAGGSTSSATKLETTSAGIDVTGNIAVSGTVDGVDIAALNTTVGTKAVLTGSTNNTIATVTGANAIQGEANLTFDGSNVSVSDGANGAVNVGATYVLLERTSGDTNYICAPNADADLVISADENLLFHTVHTADFNSTERMRIDSSGEVLIGGTAQGREKQLSIDGADQNPGGVWTQVGIYSTDSQAADKGGTLGFGGQDGSTAKQQFAAIKGAKENATSANYAGYLGFWTRPAGAVTAERLRIDSSGRVGIGSTSPVASTALFGGTQNCLKVAGSAAPQVRIASDTANQADLILQAGNSAADAYIANAASNGDLVFSTHNGTSQGERLRIYDDGDVKINDGNLVIGTAGHGIDFSAQTASSEGGVSTGDELLDHYEEGTFTPTIQGTGSANACTYTSQSGKYTRVGRLVTVDLKISWSAKTADTGQALVNGLPFAIGSNAYAGGAFALYSSNFTSGGSVVTAVTEPSSGNTYFYAALVTLDNSTWYNISAADAWENGTGHYRANFTYMV